ncbi:MAG: efflux RND transporter periplasmic adaptor subunit [Methylocystis sp.]|nr:efflux RND transporter periplasmic adaptor subunit [Methylocystis sp.]MCA3593097.1 efflux RND transporter periplasmic adaptor subunit [Methylocystis sp.]
MAGATAPHGRKALLALVVWAVLLLAVLLLAVLLLAASPLAFAQPANQAAPLGCLIQPSLLVRLGTPVEGMLSEITVRRGDLVERNQVVARLMSDVETASVALARERAENSFSAAARRHRHEFLQRRMERQERLIASNAVSPSALDEVRTEVRMAAAELLQEELQDRLNQLELARNVALLDQRTIRSPVSGVVVEVAMSPGEFRDSQKHIAVLAQMNPLHVEVFVPIARYGQIEVGHIATIMPEQPIGGRHEAVVQVVDRVFDAASGTFGVRLQLHNADLRLPAGIRCTVQFK